MDKAASAIYSLFPITMSIFWPAAESTRSGWAGKCPSAPVTKKRVGLNCRLMPWLWGLAAIEHTRQQVLREWLESALGGYGKPEIFNTDQGSQFTSETFTGRLLEAGVQVSMDGRGRWMHNHFIEQL